ncbi:MAG: exonuclease SbcCD subunit D, partial [Planctomycetota bacterium]
MKFHPQRFIHAANLRLDVPVSVISSEQLTEAQRTAFEDATLRAFDQVIESCVRHKVLCLLVSGNAFIEADRSLRARLAVLRGFTRLHEHRIRVFVLPGDSDPPEAWRAISDLPDNVTVCYSSSTEPAVLETNGHQVLAISASMWLGHTDDFGIQVISTAADELQPFRIGVISQTRCEERQRMQALAAATTDDALTRSQTNPSTAELISRPADIQPQRTAATPSPTAAQDSPLTPDERLSERGQTGEDRPVAFLPSTAFLNFSDELLHDARLNYLALTGQLERTTLWRDSGVVHSPGTPQPRSRRETTSGCCSLVSVSEAGEIRITALDTSCVDWHVIELEVETGVDLSTLLQIMKTRLLELRPGTADQYWSVQWLLRGDLPDLEHLRRSDLNTMLAGDGLVWERVR